MDKILLLDNYDSFTYNLVHLIKKVYRGKVEVKRDINSLNLEDYKALIISPGPGSPETTPIAMELIEYNYMKIPILGICLGMQCINEFFSGTTIKAPYPVHGKVSMLNHREDGLFKNIPSPVKVARYHSLIIKPGDDLIVTGKTDNIPMAIKHKSLPIHALQFHPESFLTEYGKEMIINFMELTGVQY